MIHITQPLVILSDKNLLSGILQKIIMWTEIADNIYLVHLFCANTSTTSINPSPPPQYLH